MYEVQYVNETGGMTRLGTFDLAHSHRVLTEAGDPIGGTHLLQTKLLPLWAFNCALGSLEQTLELLARRLESLRRGEKVFQLTIAEGRFRPQKEGAYLQAFPKRQRSSLAPPPTGPIPKRQLSALAPCFYPKTVPRPGTKM